MSASILNEPKCHARGLVFIPGSFQLNGTSAVSLTKGSGFSVARASAGVFNVTWTDNYYEVVSAIVSLEHTTEVDSKVCWDALSSTAKTGQIRLQSMSSASTAATGTITCDTKANTTQADYLILNDGQMRYGFELDVAGTGATRAVDGVAATCTVTCDSRTNSGDDEQFIISDGGRAYYVEIDTDGDGAQNANTDITVDISAATDTAAGSGVVLTSAINAHAIGITATDVEDGTVTLTQDNKGDSGNVANNLYTATTGAWAVTNFSGGTDSVEGVDTWTNVDISGDTTAADIGATLTASINGTDIQSTATDVEDGTVTLANDTAGAHGNAQQYEQASNAWAVTDMTAGTTVDEYADADLSAGRIHFNVVFRKADISL